MQQSRGMDEFDEGGCLDNRKSSVTASPSRQNHQERAQPLAATGDDVIRDLIYQRDGAFQASTDYAVDGLEVCPDQPADFFEGHRDWKNCIGRGTHGEPRILADAGVGENGKALPVS